MLTRDNRAPGLSYGIATIVTIARVINRALVPGATMLAARGWWLR